mgnify:CR=1 FL=1
MAFKMVTPFGKYQKGKRRYKKKKRKGTLYEGVDFSGSPTAAPSDIFGSKVSTPSMAAALSRRRKSILPGK